jgi:CHAT domain-containing protein
MERFYFNHVENKMTIPMALQDTQLWVRDLAYNRVRDYGRKRYKSGKWGRKRKDLIDKCRQRFAKMDKNFPDKKTFQHPYYWAVFTVNGA